MCVVLADKVSTNPTAYKTGRLYERVGQAVTPENEEGTQKYTRLNNQLFSVVEQSPAVSAEAADRINMVFTQAIEKTELPEEAKSVIAQKFVLPSNIEPNSYEAERYARDFADDAALAYEAGEIQQKTGEKLPDGWLQQKMRVATPEQVDYYTKLGREHVLAEQVEATSDLEVQYAKDNKKNAFSEKFADGILNGFRIESRSLGDSVHVQKHVLATLLEEGFFTNKELRNRIDVNKESGMVIEINKSSIDETFSKDNYARLGKFKKYAKLATIRELPIAIRDGHLIDDNVPNSHKNGTTNKSFAYIEYKTKIDGIDVKLKLAIKKSPQKNKFWVHSIYNIENISSYPASTQIGTEAGYRTADTENIIPQKRDSVNTNNNTSTVDLKSQYIADTPERVQARKKLLARTADEVRTATRNDTTLTAEQREAAEFGEKIGVAVGFVDTTQYYRTKRDGISLKSKGVIILDKKTENPLRQVFIHELAHFSETSKTYAKLSKKIMESKALDNWLTEKGYKGSFANKKSAYRAAKKNHYAENGEVLTKDGADAEMIANFLGETIGTEEKFNAFMSELTKEQKKNFLDYIKEVIDWFKATFTNSVPAEIRNIERLYKKALREARDVAKSKLNIKEQGVNELDSEYGDVQFVIGGKKSVDNKELKRYNDRGWAENLLSEEDHSLLKEKIQEAFIQKFHKRLKDGTKVIEVNNKIVFVSGTFDNPVIDVLFAFNSYNADYDEVQKQIILGDKVYGNYTKQDIKNWAKVRGVLYGNEIFVAYCREDYTSRSIENVKKGRRATLPESFKSYGYTGRFTIRNGVYVKDEESVSGRYEGYNSVTEDEQFSISDRKFNEEFITDTLQGFGITKPKDYIHVQRQVFSTLLNEGFFTDKEKRSRVDINKASGMIIETNKSSIDETFNRNNYALVGINKKIAKLATVRLIPQLIENGTLVKDNVPNQYKNSNNKTFAYIEANVVIEGKDITIKVDIKESPRKNKVWVHKILSIENVSSFPASTENVLRQGKTTADGKSISQSTEKVNTDEQFSVPTEAIVERKERTYGNSIPERVRARKILLARTADEVKTATKNDTTLTAEQREAAEFGEKIGVAVGFENTTQYYRTKRDGISLKSKGIIILDKMTENPLKQVFIHELAHFSETSKTYAKLSKKIMESKALDNWLTEKGYKGSFANKKSAYRAAKKNAYSENGVALTKDGADAEMIANFLGETIGTEEKFNAFMSELTGEQKKNFLDYIKEVIDWFKATFTNSVPAEIRQIEKLYKKALREAGEGVKNRENISDTEVSFSIKYKAAQINHNLLELIKKVVQGNFKSNDKVYFGIVSEKNANQIYKLTGINVKDFKVAIEARQIEHIIKDHGRNGKADSSLSDYNNIAKMEYVLDEPDEMRSAGKTQAYTQMKNGKNKTADTVLYEKRIGESSYYVVQAVPDTKAKTLYIVTAFIGKPGYKKEASQLINEKNLDVTSKNGSANASTNNISQSDETVNRKYSVPEDEQFSISENFIKDIDRWDCKTVGFSFVVGETSNALQKAGIPKKQIRWDATKIVTLLNKHDGMSLEIVKQLPELIEKPIIVVDSKKDSNSKIVMGDLYDTHGNIITVVLLLTPTSKKGNVLDIIKISSAEGRGHINSLFTYENGMNVPIRYVDKKRIHSWLNVNRLQLPLHNLDLDSNNIISQSDETVNKESLATEDEQFSVPTEAIVERKERIYGNSIPERTRKLRQEYADGKIGFNELVEGETKLMEEAREKYGTIEEGENPQERVKVPQGVEKNKNVSKYVRTILETGVVSEALAAEIGEKTLLGDLSHKVLTDEKALEDADKAIKNGTARNKWGKTAVDIHRIPTKNEIAVGEKLLEKAMKDGDTVSMYDFEFDFVK